MNKFNYSNNTKSFSDDPWILIMPVYVLKGGLMSKSNLMYRSVSCKSEYESQVLTRVINSITALPKFSHFVIIGTKSFKSKPTEADSESFLDELIEALK